MLLSLFAAAVLAGSPIARPVQDPGAAGAVALEDVIITGRRLDTLINDFVGEVAAPNAQRGLARWNDTVCVGVANLREDIAQYLADRISTIAEDLKLTSGKPGCTPNILVVATDDGDALARNLVEKHPRTFRVGGSGMDRGGAALRRFQEGARPVRWWLLAMPVNADTGQRATRIPGECSGACDGPMDYAPVTSVFAASRLRTAIVDNLFRAIVIVDVDRLEAISVQQLADYVAFVSLAQIDPDANTTSYASILNVFEDPSMTASLTNWDRAYLRGLYQAEQGDQAVRAGQSEVSRSILRAHRALRDEGEN